MALDRGGLPLFVEFAPKGELPDVNSAKRHIRAWIREDETADAVLKYSTKYISDRPLQSVYIPADLGHPHGYFVKELLRRPEHKKALIVAFFGYQNPLLCRCCIRSSTSNYSMTKEYYMWPFHACRSIPGFMDGKCANCIWNANSQCEWSFLGGYLASEPGFGTSLDLLSGMKCPIDPDDQAVSVLNHASCPRISNEFPLAWEDESLRDEAIRNAEKRAAWDESMGFFEA